ncbi:hypothetical protein D210916BOD24_23950 [Alteromonas sp. D210916BOD_24]|uniref:histidine kinase n=1 Tax=Alteromonas sp. D210916BOD_24 TaxID=3157618 RepID=UPI00399CB700
MDVKDIISVLKRLVFQPEPSLSAEQCINHWLKSAKRVLTLVNNDPAIAISVLFLDNDIPSHTQHALIFALFGKLNKFNDHYLQHLIGAFLCAHWLANEPDSNVNLTALRRFAQTRSLAIWSDVIKIHKPMQMPDKISYFIATPRLSAAQRLCLLAHFFACRNAKIPAISLFTEVTQKIAPHHRYLLQHLAPLFTQAMPGAKVFAKGVPGVLIDIQQHHGFVFMLSADQADGQWLPLSSVAMPTSSHIPFDHFIAVYSDTAQTRSCKGGTPFLPLTFAIQSPPVALLAIVDELQKRDVEIPTLCEKIEKAPNFNQFLIHTASQDNRLQLPVKNIKQAVMTYGIERVGDMLIQFALMERLTQHQFPLINMCRQFTLLSCSIASCIASQCETKFSPQSAALTMTFLCAPLFTLPGLKVAATLPVNSEESLSINTAFRVKTTTPWLAIAGELAGNWHQSATWRAVLHHCNKPSSDVPNSLKKEHAIMLIAFNLAKTALFRGNLKMIEQNDAYSTLLSLLKLGHRDMIKAVEDQTSLLYCPILR